MGRKEAQWSLTRTLGWKGDLGGHRVGEALKGAEGHSLGSLGLGGGRDSRALLCHPGESLRGDIHLRTP